MKPYTQRCRLASPSVLKRPTQNLAHEHGCDFVCMSVYVCMYVYVCIVCVYVWMYVGMCVCMFCERLCMTVYMSKSVCDVCVFESDCYCV